MKKNIILTGFMGTGKTTVGKRLAELSGWKHIDTDALIEEQLGQTIPDIFSTKGESFFREQESRILHHLLAEEEQIITTGGGIVLRPENVELMLKGGLVVALTASPEAVVERVRHDGQRPLLAGDDPEKKVRELLQQRSGKYDFAHLTIDTSHLSVDEICRLIFPGRVKDLKDQVE